MLAHITRWWLYLALLVVQPMGDNSFWHFNVMELFATFAIVVGTLWALNGRRVERKRKQKLIQFPDKWTAERNHITGDFKVYMRADVFAPHTSLESEPEVFLGGKKFPMQANKPQSVMFQQGIWFVELHAPLDSNPLINVVRSIRARWRATLDDGTTRRSEKRLINITDQLRVIPTIPEPTADTEDSQTKEAE